MIYPQKIQQALRCASQQHRNQKRKISEHPYIIHPVMVFHMVSKYTDDIDVLCAAILHDVVEDTSAELTDIHGRFGERVSYLVDMLSENKDLEYVERKKTYLDRMYNEKNNNVFLIKTADIIYNLRDMIADMSEFGIDVQNKHFGDISKGAEKRMDIYNTFKKLWPENPLLSLYKITLDTLEAAIEYDGNVQYDISCGIIPVFKNNKGENEFLVVELHHGGISFPKGHMEFGETYLETAKRELLEETGLTCIHVQDEIINEQYIIKRPEKLIHKTVNYYIGFVNTKEVVAQPEEVRSIFWGTAIEIMEKINHAESREVFKKALAQIG